MHNTVSLHGCTGSFDPHLLVLLAYSLAVADCFPEELAREIFSIDFLGKLDSQLESELGEKYRVPLVSVTEDTNQCSHYFVQLYLTPSTCGPGCASWSSIAPCVSNVPSFRCPGFMSATASSCKGKVKKCTNVPGAVV